MPRPRATGGTAPELVMLAEMENARVLAGLLQALSWGKDQLVTCQISVGGVRFTVDENKLMQGSVYVKKGLFRRYEAHPERDRPDDEDNELDDFATADTQADQRSAFFRVRLSVLIECVTIFGTNNALTGPLLSMAYAGYGNSLVLMIGENDMLTDCGISTIPLDPSGQARLNVEFRKGKVTCKAVMSTPELTAGFNEIDWNSSAVTLTISPSAPHFVVATSTAFGSCEITYPRTAFSTPVEAASAQTNKYKTSLIQPAIKCLFGKNGPDIRHTSIRMNSHGMLNIVHMVHYDGGREPSMVEFFVRPEYEDA